MTQTQLTSGAGGDSGQEKMVIDLAEDILTKVPDLYDIEQVSKKYPVIYENSMNTVLRQVKLLNNPTTKVASIRLFSGVNQVQQTDCSS